MTDRRILIVDDELSVRSSLEEWFREDGFQVETAEDGLAAIRAMERGPYDIVLLDLKMPGMDGIAVQKRVREIDPRATIIILTAYASVETAVEALKLGAFDYVTKPVDPDELSNLVRNALNARALAEENVRLKETVSELTQAAPILAVSAKMEHVLELVRTVAETDSSVVIRGESGTGKELIARAIHAQSRRRYFPLVAVNAGSIPETLLESELFGHEKGAYTGAQYRRKGKIELANGGTLFLDEIGDITPKMQIDLLRVLETHRFTRLGGNQEIESDFRLVCATHRNLEKLVEEEQFREDLFYRINVFNIQVPPLRERPEDVLPLARFFIEKYARAMGKPVKAVAPDAEAVLLAYRWPGNVRELENAVERAMVAGRGPALEARDLPVSALNGDADEPLARSLAALEKEHIARVLSDCEGNVTRAAKVLDIDRATLYNKLKRYGLRR
jgi:DNA-binding NtrC family response regulator